MITLRVTEGPAHTRQERLYFLDWLRVLAVLGVFFFYTRSRTGSPGSGCRRSLCTVHSPMERKMRLGIKQRTERVSRQRKVYYDFTEA